MPQSKKDELKARLMEEAEALIDKVVEEKKPADKILLSDIEKAAVEAGQGLQQAVAAHLAAESDRVRGEAPYCPECGKKMRFKGYRKRWVETEAGAIEIERAYYYCQTCQEGLFPPG